MVCYSFQKKDHWEDKSQHMGVIEVHQLKVLQGPVHGEVEKEKDVVASCMGKWQMDCSILEKYS